MQTWKTRIGNVRNLFDCLGTCLGIRNEPLPEQDVDLGQNKNDQAPAIVIMCQLDLETVRYNLELACLEPSLQTCPSLFMSLPSDLVSFAKKRRRVEHFDTQGRDATNQAGEQGRYVSLHYEITGTNVREARQSSTPQLTTENHALPPNFRETSFRESCIESRRHSESMARAEFGSDLGLRRRQTTASSKMVTDDEQDQMPGSQSKAPALSPRLDASRLLCNSNIETAFVSEQHRDRSTPRPLASQQMTTVSTLRPATEGAASFATLPPSHARRLASSRGQLSTISPLPDTRPIEKRYNWMHNGTLFTTVPKSNLRVVSKEQKADKPSNYVRISNIASQP